MENFGTVNSSGLGKEIGKEIQLCERLQVKISSDILQQQ